MKRTIASIMLVGTLVFGSTLSYAQSEEAANAEQVEMTEEEMANDSAVAEEAPVEEVAQVEEASTEEVVEETAMVEEEASLHQRIKEKFIEGGVTFMFPVLLCLILGLALAIERIITLNLSTTNNKKLLEEVENALDNGGTEAAIEVCRNTRR